MLRQRKRKNMFPSTSPCVGSISFASKVLSRARKGLSRKAPMKVMRISYPPMQAGRYGMVFPLVISRPFKMVRGVSWNRARDFALGSAMKIYWRRSLALIGPVFRETVLARVLYL